MTILPLLSSIYSPTAGPISIVFGSPRRNCAGHGVCRLEFQKQLIARRSRSCRAFPARLRYDTDLRRLGLQVRRTDLSDAIWEKQFGQGCFVVEEPYRVSRPITRMLGLPRTIIILPGSYAFTLKGSIVTCYVDTEGASIHHRATRTQSLHS